MICARYLTIFSPRRKRSTIWYYDKDEQLYRGIYCHWDGYLEGVGITLLKSFNFEEGAKAIIERGSCRSLYPRLDPISNWHSFDTPEPGTSVFYHRDRGEPLRIFTAKSLLEAGKYFQNYDYLWNDGEWYLIGDDFLNLTKLSEVLRK